MAMFIRAKYLMVEWAICPQVVQTQKNRFFSLHCLMFVFRSHKAFLRPLSVSLSFAFIFIHNSAELKTENKLPGICKANGSMRQTTFTFFSAFRSFFAYRNITSPSNMSFFLFNSVGTWSQCHVAWDGMHCRLKNHIKFRRFNSKNSFRICKYGHHVRAAIGGWKNDPSDTKSWKHDFSCTLFSQRKLLFITQWTL